MKSLFYTCHCWQRCMHNPLSTALRYVIIWKDLEYSSKLSRHCKSFLSLLQNLFYAFFPLFRVSIIFLSSDNWHTIIFSTATRIIISYTLPVDWISNSRINKPRCSILSATPPAKNYWIKKPHHTTKDMFTLWSVRLLYNIQDCTCTTLISTANNRNSAANTTDSHWQSKQWETCPQRTARNKKTWLTSWLLEMSRIFSRSLIWCMTSFNRSFSLFPMTCTFSLASRQSLPSALTSNWQDISCSDATFSWDSSSSRLICCCQGKHRIF